METNASAAELRSVSEESVLQAGLATGLDKSLWFEKPRKQRIFMKRFIPTIAILLPLIFFVHAGRRKAPRQMPRLPVRGTRRNDCGVAKSGSHRRRNRYYDRNLEYRRRQSRAKFMFRRMAHQIHFSLRAQRGRPRHLGSRRGRRLSFAYMRGPSTPRCLPKLRSRVANKSRIDSPCGCFGSSHALNHRSVRRAD